LRRRQVVELDADAVDPVAVRPGGGERVFQFAVVDDAAVLDNRHAVA